jgi:hypothetical protein
MTGSGLGPGGNGIRCLLREMITFRRMAPRNAATMSKKASMLIVQAVLQLSCKLSALAILAMRQIDSPLYSSPEAPALSIFTCPRITRSSDVFSDVSENP